MKSGGLDRGSAKTITRSDSYQFNDPYKYASSQQMQAVLLQYFKLIHFQVSISLKKNINKVKKELMLNSLGDTTNPTIFFLHQSS